MIIGRSGNERNKLVEAVNLAWHEEEAAVYDGRHPEILEAERVRWRQIAGGVSALKRKRGSIAVLDFGTGTGFVPRQLAPVLDESDSFVITDLSPAMLERARANLAADGFRAKLMALVGPAEGLDLGPASFDVVTMNSVVHHFPEVPAALAAADRALKPGGLMVIAHEPNSRHFSHFVVGTLDRVFRSLRHWRAARRDAESATADPFVAAVNRRLIERGAIRAPMTAEEMESLVDIHSPTAGRRVRPERGFDPLALVAEHLQNYRVESLLTYQHFGKVNVSKSWLLRPLAALVERLWPLEGALFTIILRKPE